MGRRTPDWLFPAVFISGMIVAMIIVPALLNNQPLGYTFKMISRNFMRIFS